MSTDHSPINLPHEENQEKSANSSDSIADSIADSEETIFSYPVSRSMSKPRHNDDGACSNPKPSSDSEPKSSAPALGSEKKKRKRSVRWSTEDEVTLLRGMSEYMSTKKYQPSGREFHEYVINNLNLSSTLSMRRLSDKIYSLRMEFEANVIKSGSNGPAHFVNSHKKIAFDLSKFIWGPEAVLTHGFAVQPRKTKPKAKKAEAKADVILALPVQKIESKKAALASKFLLSSSREMEDSMFLSEYEKKLIIERLSLGGDGVHELAEKCTGWIEEDLELRMKRIDLVKRQRKAALEIQRASSSSRG